MTSFRHIPLLPCLMTGALLLAIAANPSQWHCSAFVMTLSSTPPLVKGSAARPFEKKKVAVFGAGGYLGGCIYGFLQRAGSLYGTGISGVGGSPRAIVSTSAGSVSLNRVLSKNFLLAQADESFVKLTNMTSTDAIRSRLNGFDAAVVATRYTLEPRPVTLGSYENSPNDKTKEFYMERPHTATVKGVDEPDYNLQLFQNILQSSKAENLGHLVVIETDSQWKGFVGNVGNKYLQLLEESGTPYTYIRPLGSFVNYKDFTFVKGVQSSLQIFQATSLQEFKPSNTGSIYREDIAAVCVQALMSLDWGNNRVLQVEGMGSLEWATDSKAIPQREWCVNSDRLRDSLSVAFS